MFLKSKTFLAIVIFVILLGLVILLQEDPYETPETSALPVLPELSADAVDKIEIVNKTEAITFEKRGDDWFITSPAEYKADKSFSSLIVDKLAEVSLDRVVSENKDKHSQFSVDEEGSHVKALSQGREILTLIVGKNTPDFRSNFLRLPDSDTVYASKLTLGSGFKKSVQDWRDKSLFDGSLTKDDVKNISFSVKKTTYGFTFNEAKEATEGEAAVPAGWVCDQKADFPVDTARLDGMLGSLFRLRWSDIVEKPAGLTGYGLDKPEASLTVTRKTGESQTLLFGNEDEQKRLVWVMLKGDTKVYQIPKYQKERFIKEQSYYKGEATQ